MHQARYEILNPRQKPRYNSESVVSPGSRERGSSDILSLTSEVSASNLLFICNVPIVILNRIRTATSIVVVITPPPLQPK